MNRPMVVDSFMINDELEMLECRLHEIGDVVDYVIAVEADVDHQDHPKPFYLTENLDRFSEWEDKLVVVRATGLPTVAASPDPWSREHAQREFVGVGLHRIDAPSDAVVMHGDVDEIPTRVAARNLRPSGLTSLAQRGHFWSCKWLYPMPWMGTVAGRLGSIQSFGAMRDTRNIAPSIPNAGWHLSWMPKAGMSVEEAALAKVGSYCHPEVTDRIVSGLATNRFLVDGVHVDGVKMTRCEIDASFPRYVREGRCPESWLI
jgi:hypothetical protein